jgi:hypothetical protein
LVGSSSPTIRYLFSRITSVTRPTALSPRTLLSGTRSKIWKTPRRVGAAETGGLVTLLKLPLIKWKNANVGGAGRLPRFTTTNTPNPSSSHDEGGDDLTLFAKKTPKERVCPETNIPRHPARTGSGTGARTVAYTYPPPIIPAVYFVGRNGVVQTRIRKTGVLLHTQ